MVQRTDFSLANLASFYSLCFFSISVMVFLSGTQPVFLTDVLGIHSKLVCIIIIYFIFYFFFFNYSNI